MSLVGLLEEEFEEEGDKGRRVVRRSRRGDEEEGMENGRGRFHIFAESVWAFASAWASSAGSFVAGLPGVVYAWFRLGWEGPLGSSPDMIVVAVVIVGVLLLPMLLVLLFASARILI